MEDNQIEKNTPTRKDKNILIEELRQHKDKLLTKIGNLENIDREFAVMLQAAQHNHEQTILFQTKSALNQQELVAARFTLQRVERLLNQQRISSQLEMNKQEEEEPDEGLRRSSRSS